MKDTKRKAHELAAIVESVADEDGMVGPEPESVRKTAHWKQIGNGQDEPIRYYCSACNERANVFTRDGDLVDIAPFMNGWRFCPTCGAVMISEAG